MTPREAIASKNSPLGPKKEKNDPDVKSKSNVRIEGNIENEVVQLHQHTLKLFLNMFMLETF